VKKKRGRNSKKGDPGRTKKKGPEGEKEVGPLGAQKKKKKRRPLGLQKNTRFGGESQGHVSVIVLRVEKRGEDPGGGREGKKQEMWAKKSAAPVWAVASPWSGTKCLIGWGGKEG